MYEKWIEGDKWIVSARYPVDIEVRDCILTFTVQAEGKEYEQKVDLRSGKDELGPVLQEDLPHYALAWYSKWLIDDDEENPLFLFNVRKTYEGVEWLHIDNT